MPVEPQKLYISSKEAARKYALTNDHIGLLCRRGKISGLLWGRVWYVSEPSLEDYVKKSLALKEARKKVLSKQWHAAWAAAFAGLLMFGLSAPHASADYVTPAPHLQPAPTPAQLSIASIAASVGEFEKSVPVPQIPKLVAQPAEENNGQFFADMGSGLVLVGESAANIFGSGEAGPSGPSVRVVYASDFVPASLTPGAFVTPRAAKNLSSPDQLIGAVAASASAVLAQTPVPDLSLAPLPPSTLITADNLMAGTIAANEILNGANETIFSAYLQSLSDLARVAQFDAQQAGYVFDQIFGEFGRHYVADLTGLNELQVSAYMRAGEAVNDGYNSLADAIGRIPSMDASISVASIGKVPGLYDFAR